jgi:threonine/homoserine/homoserine lactone efflux protein
MLGIADYGAFCAAILVFLALPGPRHLCLAHLHRQGRLSRGAAATLGVILGDQVLLWLAVAGVAALLAANPLLFQGVQYSGAAYLAWIGLKLIFAQPGSRQPGAHRAAPLRAPGVFHHPAQPQGHRLLHGLLPALHRPRHATAAPSPSPPWPSPSPSSPPCTA